MEEVVLEVETITPLFIAGADQRHIENEGLRAPSLRGLLRWWFRAIMGGMVSVDNLIKLEKEVFGWTEQKSSIRILSLVEDKPSLMKIEKRRDLQTNHSKSFLILEKPNAPSIQLDLSSGLGYLWFSVSMQVKQNQRLQCYPPGTKFKIMLTSNKSDNLKIALGALWCLIYLGGIGSRMRRGAGSLKVSKATNKIPYEFIFNGNSISDAKKFIERNLAMIFKDFKNFAGKKFEPQKSPKFAVLSYAKISLVNTPSTQWENILEKVGKIYQSFRSTKRLEHRYTLGLPIIQHSEFRNLRQSSPLFIGVMDLNRLYTLRIVKFYTSIHRNFFHRLEFLKNDLDRFNAIVEGSTDLGEIEIKVPEVK